MKEEYRKEVTRQIEGYDRQGPEKRWKSLKEAMEAAARNSLGYQTNKKKNPWITKEILGLIDERRSLKGKRNNENYNRRYKQLNNQIRREAIRAKEQWLEKRCKQIEALSTQGKIQQMYKNVNEFNKSENRSISSNAIKSKDDRLLTEPKDIKARWKEHIEELYAASDRQEEIGLELEEEVDRDNLGPGLLRDEVTKAVRHLKTGKTAGDDGIPAELVKSLDANGAEEINKLCQEMYETGIWPDDFTSVRMKPIPKKAGTQKCGDYRTLSLISHTSKVMLNILKERLESKIEEYLGEDQFGFRKGRGTRDAIGALRILSERTIEVGKELNVCFIDYEKAFDRVDWNKMMRILKQIGIDWRDRRLIANLYLDQRVTVETGVGDTEPCKIGRGSRQGCILSPILYNLYSEMLIREALEGHDEGVRVGGQLVQSIRYADDSSIVADTETGLQKLIDSVVNHAKNYGMKVNIVKTKVMRIAKQRSGNLQIYIGNTQVEEVKSFRYLGSIVSSDGTNTNDIKARIGTAKAAFLKNKTLQSNKINLGLRARLARCYVWSTATYAAETWTLKAEEKGRLECLERWIWRKLLGIRWQDRISNERLLRMTGQDNWKILQTIKTRKEDWLRKAIEQGKLLQLIIEGKIEGKRPKGRPRLGILNGLGTYHNFKRQ